MKKAKLLVLSTIALSLLAACGGNKESKNSSTPVSSNGVSSVADSSSISPSSSENKSSSATSSKQEESSQKPSSSSQAKSSSQPQSSSQTASSSKPQSSSQAPSSSKVEVKYSATLLEDENVSIALKVGFDMTNLKANTKVLFRVISKSSDVEITGAEVTGLQSSRNIEVTKNGDYYEFLMPEENVQIKGLYSMKRFQVLLADGLSDKVYFSVIGREETFKAGEEAGFSVTPKPGYSLVSYSVKGVSNNPVTITSDHGTGTVYFVMPAENVIVNAVVSETHTITVNKSEHSTVTIQDEKSYYKVDTEIKFSVKMTSDFYLLNEVKVTYVDGSQTKEVQYTEVSGTYTFTMPDFDVTITVTETEVDLSGDPFANKPMVFEGNYEYNDSYTLYYMQLRFYFDGQGCLAWYLTYDYDDDWGDWWTYEDEPVQKPNIYYASGVNNYVRDNTKPEGMNGEIKDGFKNISYIYNTATEEITFTTGYKASSISMSLKVGKDDAGNVETLTLVEGMDTYDGYYKNKGLVCTKIG